MKKFTIIIGFFLSLTSTFGQDLHFSQFYSNPQMLNPALTGNFKEDYRLNIHHRDQWSGIGSSFATTAFGGDINFKGGKLNHDKVGLGVQVYLDNETDILKTQGFMLATSYMHTLDHHRRHRIAGGIQLGYMSKSIDAETLTFGSQYQNNQYDPNAPTNEALDGPDLNNITIQLGLGYTYDISIKTQAFTGLSIYQLTAPKESISNTENQLGRRFLYNLGVSHQISNKVKLIPQFMYAYQSGASDFNIGSLMKYELAPTFKTNLILGGFLRPGDAVVALLGFEHGGLETKFSYDVTLSDLNNAKKSEGASPNNMVGAWEISVIWKGIFQRHNYPNDYTVPCGIF